MLDCGDGYATSVPLVVEIQSPAECEGRPGLLGAFFISVVRFNPWWLTHEDTGVCVFFVFQPGMEHKCVFFQSQSVVVTRWDLLSKTC